MDTTTHEYEFTLTLRNGTRLSYKVLASFTLGAWYELVNLLWTQHRETVNGMTIHEITLTSRDGKPTLPLLSDRG